MVTRDESDEPTQTTPEGAEIPVPSKDEFFGNLAKVAPSARPLPTPTTNDLEGLARIEEILIGSTVDEANKVLGPAGWTVQEQIRTPGVVVSSEGRWDRIRVDVVDGRITAFKIG